MTGEEVKQQVEVDPVKDMFGIELESTIQNMEKEDEESYIQKEHVLKLPCHIDNNNKPIDSLQAGLKISLSGDLEKYSDSLGRNALFSKTSKIAKLPNYICIQFVRFYWKKESTVGGTKAGKAKILRSVAYPRLFDAYEFCTENLQKSLNVGRDIEQKEREEEDVARLEGKKKEAEESDQQMAGKVDAQTDEQKEAKRLVGKAAKAQR